MTNGLVLFSLFDLESHRPTFVFSYAYSGQLWLHLYTWYDETESKFTSTLSDASLFVFMGAFESFSFVELLSLFRDVDLSEDLFKRAGPSLFFEFSLCWGALQWGSGETVSLTGTWGLLHQSPVIILGMGSANKRRRYNVTSSLIGWVHTQNDPWISSFVNTLYFQNHQNTATCVWVIFDRPGVTIAWSPVTNVEYVIKCDSTDLIHNFPKVKDIPNEEIHKECFSHSNPEHYRLLEKIQCSMVTLSKKPR